MISGGMGSSAVQIFNENDIEVIVGVKGSARKVVQDYLEGKLEVYGTVAMNISTSRKVRNEPMKGI